MLLFVFVGKSLVLGNCRLSTGLPVRVAVFVNNHLELYTLEIGLEFVTNYFNASCVLFELNINYILVIVLSLPNTNIQLCRVFPHVFRHMYFLHKCKLLKLKHAKLKHLAG